MLEGAGQGWGAVPEEARQGWAQHQVLAEGVNARALCTESEHFTHSRAFSRSIISLSVVPGRKECQSPALQITGRTDRPQHWGLGKEAGVPSKSSSVEAEVLGFLLF